MAGGGVALLRAKQAITDLKGDTADQNAGIKLILRAVEEPLRTIVANAGEEASVVVNNVLNGKGNYGYNAATGEYTDLVEQGVLDPTKVTRTALQNAASVASLLLTAEAAVVELAEDKPAAPAMPVAWRHGRHGLLSPAVTALPARGRPGQILRTPGPSPRGFFARADRSAARRPPPLPPPRTDLAMRPPRRRGNVAHKRKVSSRRIRPYNEGFPARARPMRLPPSLRLLRPSEIGGLLMDSINQWSDRRASSKGAALALYMVFSLAPMLILVIAVAGAFFGEDAVRSELFTQLRDLTGERGAEVIQTVLASAHESGGGWIAALISIFVLIFSATTAFAELKASLDELWDVSARQKGLQGMVRSRMLSFGLVLVLALFLLISLTVNAGLAAARKYYGDLWTASSFAVVAEWISNLFSFSVVVALFAVIFAAAQRAHHLARRDSRRHRDGRPVPGGQMGHRRLPEPGRGRVGLWRGRLADRAAAVDLLLGADLLLRRGVHAPVRAALRQGASHAGRRAARARRSAAHLGAAARRPISACLSCCHDSANPKPFVAALAVQPGPRRYERPHGI